MYIKLIGAILCAAGCFGYGYYLSSCVNDRVRNLQYTKEVLLIVKSNIEQEYLSIPSILMKLSEKAKNESYKSFFCDISRRLKEDTEIDFKSCWCEGIHKYLSSSNLTTEDIAVINHFGDLPLYLDGEAQISQINQIITQLDYILDKARMEAAEKCRVYKCCGGAIGLMLVLIII